MLKGKAPYHNSHNELEMYRNQYPEEANKMSSFAELIQQAAILPTQIFKIRSGDFSLIDVLQRILQCVSMCRAKRVGLPKDCHLVSAVHNWIGCLTHGRFL